MLRATLPQFGPVQALSGWMNRILRVDLSELRIWAQPSAPLVPDLIGGRGLTAAILWDEYPEPVDPFDERAPLMVMPGALTCRLRRQLPIITQEDLSSKLVLRLAMSAIKQERSVPCQPLGG